jgi:hypothetical protein
MCHGENRRPNTELTSTLTEDEREQLVRRSHRAKFSQVLALRSSIVLPCADWATTRVRQHC